MRFHVWLFLCLVNSVFDSKVSKCVLIYRLVKLRDLLLEDSDFGVIFHGIYGSAGQDGSAWRGLDRQAK